MNELEQYRTELDRINRQILGLLIQRFVIVHKIAILKQSKGQALHDPLREEQMIEDISEQISHEEMRTDLLSIFREIFRSSISYMKKQQ